MRWAGKSWSTTRCASPASSPAAALWVAGYSNDVFGYVPSRRVLREGGYEGGDAMIYYGRPGPFTDDVEEIIVRECRRLMRR